MIYRRMMVSAVAAAVLAAACSPAVDPPQSESIATASPKPPASSSTAQDQVGTPLLDVAFERFALAADAEPFPVPSLNELMHSADYESAPVVVFTQRYTFEPRATELSQAGPIKFTNESDREIEITFREDGYPPVTLAPGEEAKVVVPSDGSGRIQFATVVGQARVTGSARVADAEQPTADTPGGEPLVSPTAVTDRFGALLMEVPRTTSWRQNRGYWSFTLSPESTSLAQGSLPAALLNGVVPFEPGLRVDASTTDTPDTAADRLTDAAMPAGCLEVGDGTVSHPDFPTTSRRFDCGEWDVELGFMELPDRVAHFVLSEPTGETLGMHEALAGLSVHPPGTFVDHVEEHPPLWNVRGPLVPPNGEVELDITNGRFGPPSVTYRYHYQSGETVRVRNFDIKPRTVLINGEPLARIESRTGLEFSVDGFETQPVVVSVGEDPWARLDVFLDTAMRRPRPPLEMSTHFDNVRLEDFEDDYLLVIWPMVFHERVPVGWAQADTADGYRYTRDADAHDVAAFSRDIYSARAQDAVSNTSVELRANPTVEGEFDPPEGATFHRWEVPGRPTVTLVIAPIGDAPDGFAMVYKLVSAPEEHQHLLDELLVPAVLEFKVDSLYG